MTSVSLPASPDAPALPWRLLGGLTLLVLLAHAWVLQTLPSGGPTRSAASLATGAFETRTLTLPAPPPAAPVHTAAVPVRAPEPARHSTETTPLAPSAAEKPSEPAPDSPPPDNNGSSSGIAAAAGATLLAGAAQAQDAAGAALPVPPPKRLLYEVKAESKGFPISLSAKGELLWAHDGKNYDARMEISHFLLGTRVQTSKGAITPRGLEPLRFGDKTRKESEVAAHFQRDKSKVSFSANTPDAALEPGAQDNLSVFMQVAALLGAHNGRFPGGASASFQAIGPRSAETWVFKIVQSETLKLPGGELQTVKLTRDPVNENDARAEMWMAPSLGYLPARIRLSSKDDVVDQLWRSTQNP